MILSVTPNPSLDRVIRVRGLQPGQFFQGQHTLIIAAGKGVSMARAARTLGAAPVCAGFIGGDYGAQHEQLLKQEGLKTAWTHLASPDAETRITFIFVDPDTGKSTVINELGPTVGAEDWTRFETDVLREAAHCDFVSFSGSLPPGASPQAFAHLIRRLGQDGRPVWVDASADPLRAALTARPAAIKINDAEAGFALGREVGGVEGAFAAASDLRQAGIETVVITLGEHGAILVSSAGQWWAQPPSVQVTSAVGSGDSLLGGLITALSQGADLPEALRTGVAAGGANVLSLGAGQFELADFKAVFAETVVHHMH